MRAPPPRSFGSVNTFGKKTRIEKIKNKEKVGMNGDGYAGNAVENAQTNFYFPPRGFFGFKKRLVVRLLRRNARFSPTFGSVNGCT